MVGVIDITIRVERFGAGRVFQAGGGRAGGGAAAGGRRGVARVGQRRDERRAVRVELADDARVVETARDAQHGDAQVRVERRTIESKFIASTIEEIWV